MKNLTKVITIFLALTNSTEAQWSSGGDEPGGSIVSTTLPAPSTTSTSLTPIPSTTTSTILPAQALLAAYGFEEATGANLLDSSNNGRTGALGSAARVATGRFGRAILTTGGIGNAPAPGAVRTAMAWVQPVAVNTGWRCPLSNWGGTSAAWFLCALNNAAAPGTFANGMYQEVIGPTGAIQANIWVHLAATYDGTTIRNYVNGMQVATAASTVIPSSTTALVLGQTVAGERFAGVLDEVRLYSTVQTAAQIIADMNTPIVPTTSTTSTSSTSMTSFTSSSTTTTVICCYPSEEPCP